MPGSQSGYFVVGTGDPVVMLHSSLGSKSQWTALAEQLSNRCRVIALDLCGYGDNPAPSTAATFTLDDEVRLVTAHLDRLVAPQVRVHVVGHSYGGLVALRFAQCHGDRVASLSLYEPVAFRLLDDGDAALSDIARLADQVTRLVAAGRRHDAAQAFVDYWSGDGSSRRCCWRRRDARRAPDRYGTALRSRLVAAVLRTCALLYPLCRRHAQFHRRAALRLRARRTL
jgi:pimeloyl-ACP methyl ester carboxylesterase